MRSETQCAPSLMRKATEDKLSTPNLGSESGLANIDSHSANIRKTQLFSRPFCGPTLSSHDNVCGTGGCKNKR